MKPVSAAVTHGAAVRRLDSPDALTVMDRHVSDRADRRSAVENLAMPVFVVDAAQARLDEAIAARADMAEVIEAAGALVARTFAAAQRNEDERRAAMRSKTPVYPPAELLWCRVDALNPCWSPGQPTVAPVRHWGWTPDMPGDDGLACEHCRLRAALARAQGSQS